MIHSEKLSYFAGRRPRIMAHRGSSGSFPENTMVSFEQAVKDGADILEMDVHMSLDGEVVVIHDPTVDRTTNGAGLIKQMPYAAIREFDAGYRFTVDAGRSFPHRGKGIVIPRFVEILTAFPEMPINVEIKEANPALISKMNELLRSFGRIQNKSVLVAADANSIMHAFRSLASDAITGHCRSEVYRFVASAWLRLPGLFGRPRGLAFQIPSSKLGLTIPTRALVRQAHLLGTEVHVWTVNDPAQMAALLDLGVDGIFTDEPLLMRQLLESKP